MAVHIRLQKVGRKKTSLYRIVAMDSRKRRDGKPLEVLGNYNPCIENGFVYNKERIQYWLAQGAEASDRIRTTLKKQGVWGTIKRKGT